MRPQRQALVERERAMIEKTCRFAGNRRLEKSVAIAFAKHRAFEEGHHFIENGDVAGDIDIMRNGIGQPASVVRNAGANSAV